MMGTIRESLSFLTALAMFVLVLLLFQAQVFTYQEAYRQLSRMLSHPSVVSEYEE